MGPGFVHAKKGQSGQCGYRGKEVRGACSWTGPKFQKQRAQKAQTKPLDASTSAPIDLFGWSHRLPYTVIPRNPRASCLNFSVECKRTSLW